MAKQDLVIRIAGEAGEGVLSTGQLLAQAAARGGFKVLTYFSPPAEIKGGLSSFQIRLSGTQLFTEGDQLDILLAFNHEAFDRNLVDLRPGGLLVYDSSELTPPEIPGHTAVALPLTEIAKTKLRFELGKNVVAVGAMAALFGLPTEHMTRLLRERFGRKGEEILNKNFEALQAGLDYVRENFPERDQYALTAGPISPNDIIVSGNQAIALGALAGGVGFFAGYPITPASDIMESLAENLPKMGGSVIQAEDEIAAIGMVLGASYAGKKAMTSTSGPGFSLMTEMLGLATMAELPCVIVDAQRAGPSTGMPTRHEQGDLNLAVFGGHGEVPRIVLAPTSVADCFDETVNAFNLAERFQLPVIILSDTVLAVRTENIHRPDLNALRIENRLLYKSEAERADAETVDGQNGAKVSSHNGNITRSSGADPSYRRYDLTTPDGVSPMSLPGQPGGQYSATGLEHSDRGRPRYDFATHSAMTKKRFRKLEAARQIAPPPLRHGDPNASIGIVTWGSTAGAVIEAINLARERGISAELLAPRMLRPLPDEQIAPFLESKQILLVPEVNYSGQLADMLTARYRCELRRINVYGGTAFKVSQLVEAIVQASADLPATAGSGVALA